LTEQTHTSEAALSERYRKAYQKNPTATVVWYRTFAHESENKLHSCNKPLFLVHLSHRRPW